MSATCYIDTTRLSKIPVPLNMSNLRYHDDTCSCGIWHTGIIYTPLLTSVVVIQHTIRPIYILFFTLFRLLSSFKEKKRKNTHQDGIHFLHHLNYLSMFHDSANISSENIKKLSMLIRTAFCITHTANR